MYTFSFHRYYQMVFQVVVPIYSATYWAWEFQWGHTFLLASVQVTAWFSPVFPRTPSTGGIRQRTTLIQSLGFVFQGWRAENWRCRYESRRRRALGILLTSEAGLIDRYNLEAGTRSLKGIGGDVRPREKRGVKYFGQRMSLEKCWTRWD